MKSVSFSDLTGISSYSFTKPTMSEDNLVDSNNFNMENGTAADSDSMYPPMNSRNNSYNKNEKTDLNNSNLIYLNHRNPSKSLTHYKSTEDILKRFSTNYPSHFSNDNSSKSSNHDQQPRIHTNSFSDYNKINDDYKESLQTTEVKPTKYDKPLYSTEVKPTKYDSTTPLYSTEVKPTKYDSSKDQYVKELKEQLAVKDSLISKLQSELASERNRNDEIMENTVNLEKRIKYLEHMIAAFSEDDIPEDNDGDNYQVGEEKENCYKYEIGSFQKPTSTPNKEDYSQKPSTYQSRMSRSFTKSDIKSRPSSADSAMPYPYDRYNKKESSQIYSKYNDPIRDGARSNDLSLSEKQLEKKSPLDYHSGLTNYNTSKYDSKKQSFAPPMTNTDFIIRHRQKLDHDRSTNLNEFKQRLDDITKMVQKSCDQNTLSGDSILSNDYNPQSRYNRNPIDYSVGPRVTTTYSPALNASTETRPPAYPSHKSRKTQYGSRHRAPFDNYNHQHLNSDDENLKERVRKILEKNNYPVDRSTRPIGSDSKQMMTNEMPYRRQNEYSNDSGKSTEPRVPRLDLSKNVRERNEKVDIDPETSNLLQKYLNYSAY